VEGRAPSDRFRIVVIDRSSIHTKCDQFQLNIANCAILPMPDIRCLPTHRKCTANDWLVNRTKRSNERFEGLTNTEKMFYIEPEFLKIVHNFGVHFQIDFFLET
jgi:hypothetical protein